MNCVMCELKIAPGEKCHSTVDGTLHYHDICWDIAINNLAAELEAYADRHPEIYEKLPNGNWKILKL